MNEILREKQALAVIPTHEAPVDSVSHDAARIEICLIDSTNVVIFWKVANRREESPFPDQNSNCAMDTGK
jgi:hypothetical protein